MKTVLFNLFSAILTGASSIKAAAYGENLPHATTILPPNLQFGYVGLSVANITREMEWYQHMLGFEYIETQLFDPSSAIQVVILRNAADVRVELRAQPDSIPDTRNATGVSDLGTIRGLLNWSLQVDNVDTLYQRLTAAGVDSFVEPVDTPTGDRFCMIRDPEKNIIELIQHPRS